VVEDEGGSPIYPSGNVAEIRVRLIAAGSRREFLGCSLLLRPRRIEEVQDSEDRPPPYGNPDSERKHDRK